MKSRYENWNYGNAKHKKNRTIVTFSVCDIFVEIAGCDVDNGVGIGYYKTNKCFKTQN